jgi:hypothetical protein
MRWWCSVCHACWHIPCMVSRPGHCLCALSPGWVGRVWDGPPGYRWAVGGGGDVRLARGPFKDGPLFPCKGGLLWSRVERPILLALTWPVLYSGLCIRHPMARLSWHDMSPSHLCVFSPSPVISMRCMVQFVGREAKYRWVFILRTGHRAMPGQSLYLFWSPSMIVWPAVSYQRNVAVSSVVVPRGIFSSPELILPLRTELGSPPGPPTLCPDGFCGF